MDPYQYSQMEFFSTVEGARQAPSRSLLSRVWGYEKLILSAIGFIVATVVAFSLGVEKGRRLSDVQRFQRMDTAYKKAPAVQQVRPQAVIPKTPPLMVPQKTTAPVLVPSVTAQGDSTYTIQVASYKSRDAAQREMGALKKKGLNSVLITKGTYVILCVGKFSTKETANVLLSELKKQYRDCLIRRI